MHVILMFIYYNDLFWQLLAYLCGMDILLQSAPREGQETQAMSNTDSIFYKYYDLQLFVNIDN